ncbi:hypothetical protein [Phenylobacterium sp.]|uniref:hypothetical protein n=1 Tax=Phenylobacterium sp. TaxID=1871053 RepID=UPI003BAB8B62
MDVVFTIVSRNYAAQAATLMQSLAAAEPDLARVVIATDGPIAFSDPAIRVIEAGTFTPNFAAMCAYYDALELNTAVKPHAFRALLAESGVTSAVYLDPDIFVYRPLVEVREALARAPLALTPHMTRPLKGEANPNDHVILTSGAYNLGFMAVRNEPQIEALLDWWAEKLEFDCRVDFAAGLFTDQKWMDLAPGLVSDLAILRTPALNLAYWNLEGRTLEKTADGWRVDSEPLGFFHFSGFDPARPDLLSKHQDRIKVAPGSPLAELLKDYAGAMLRNGHAETRTIAYGHRGFPSGRLVTPDERRRMLAAARAGEPFGGGLTAAAEAWLDAPSGESARQPVAPPPGPWLGSSEDLVRWLRDTSPASVLAAMLAGRRDLRDRFADDDRGLRAWLLGPEALAGRFDARLLSTDIRDPGLVARAARYVVGEAPEARLQVAAYGLADRAGWPHGLTDPSLEAPAAHLARGLPFPCLFLDIWEDRGDLQRLFPLASFGQRFAFLRWLIGGGLAELGIDVAALPASVRNHPVFRLARLTVRHAPQVPRRPPALGACPTLVVMERWAEGAGAPVFEAATTRFRSAAGGPALPPAQVGEVVFQTDRGLIPADAIALLAHGVAWRAARA